jgi:hypothetical protein
MYSFLFWSITTEIYVILNSEKTIRRNALWLLRLTALICSLLAGCESIVSWQEEVKLRTGQVITVDREVKHVGGGAAWPQGQGTVPREYLIRFRYPPNTGQVIEWHSTKFDLPRASYAELPLVLDLDVNNAWFIYTMQWVNDYCIRYVKYEWRQDGWVETTLSEESIEMHETNLYLSADSNAIQGNISLGTKRQENNSGAYLWFFKAVGPYQVMPTFFKGYEPHQMPPMNNKLRCIWEPASQTFKMINIAGDKK